MSLIAFSEPIVATLNLASWPSRYVCVSPKIETRRVHRTALEKLLLWERAYETKITEGECAVIARGSSVEASQRTAIRKWNVGIETERRGR
jgi:hypothetical protein